jgi:hypothetical protein
MESYTTGMGTGIHVKEGMNTAQGICSGPQRMLSLEGLAGSFQETQGRTGMS